MRKTSDSIPRSERGAFRGLVAIALSGSLAAFGCSTNRTPGYGEPAMSAPAAGSVAPNPTSTPGSSSGTLPMAMISSSSAAGESAAVDAIATIKADEAFRGKNLGAAALGDNSRPSLSMLQPTGKQINVVPPPAGFYATTPPFLASADTGIGAVVPATGVKAGAAIGGTTATPITTGVTVAGGVVSPAGVTVAAGVPSTGTAVAAGAPATMTTVATSGAASGAFAAVGGTTGLSSTTATPILSGVGPLPGTLTAARSGTVTGGTTVRSTTITAGVTPSPTVRTARVTSGRLGTATAGIANPAAGMTTTGGSTTAGIRVETAPNGSVVVTNSSPSAFRRFLNSLGFRRTTTNQNQ